MAGDLARGEPRSSALLGDGDPPAVSICNPQGRAPFLLVGDHAGNLVPRALAGLGVSEAERARHIGWDIGVRALGEGLAAALDATFVAQTYSRLVIDCNRDPAAPDAMPAASDGTPVPGNADLNERQRAARVAAIHAPYQAAIGDAIAGRANEGRETILVALHSFTPALADGALRPWQVGVLHNGANDAFAQALLRAFRAEPGLTVGDNEPYQMDGIDYTVPRHAFHTRLPYAEIEVRQDLIGDADGVAGWAERLARCLTVAAVSQTESNREVRSC